MYSILAGVEMGFTDYLSRNASGEAEPESSYDEKFVVASIDAFFNACNIIKDINPEEKGKPKQSKQTKSANYISKIPAEQANKIFNRLPYQFVHFTSCCETSCDKSKETCRIW